MDIFIIVYYTYIPLTNLMQYYILKINALVLTIKEIIILGLSNFQLNY